MSMTSSSSCGDVAMTSQFDDASVDAAASVAAAAAMTPSFYRIRVRSQDGKLDYRNSLDSVHRCFTPDGGDVTENNLALHAAVIEEHRMIASAITRKMTSTSASAIFTSI